MRKIYFVAALAALSLLCGCSQNIEGVDSETVAAKSELSIGLPIGISRTAMSDGVQTKITESKNREAGMFNAYLPLCFAIFYNNFAKRSSRFSEER